MTVYGEFFSELGARAMSLVGMNRYIATNKNGFWQCNCGAIANGADVSGASGNLMILWRSSLTRILNAASSGSWKNESVGERKEKMALGIRINGVVYHRIE
jgi:hypothetical protein